MNCGQCQQEMVESLAAGQQFLSSEAGDHVQSCARCAEYFQTQRELFRSIDAGLHSLVNQPIPPSFLPGVRMRLAEQPSLAANARWHWHITAVGATALLAICIGYASRKPVLHLSSPPKVVSSQRAFNDSPALPIQSAAPSPALLHTKSNAHRSSSAPRPMEPEVIVSAEERQAFVRFLADSPEPTDVAVLARAIHERGEDPVEIGLLQIKTLEVKPLDETASE